MPFFMNLSAPLLRQYLNPVGGGPSSNTWPKWAPQRAHVISVLTNPWLISFNSLMFLGSIDLKKLGHPQPESNFVSDKNKGVIQTTQ